MTQQPRHQDLAGAAPTRAGYPLLEWARTLRTPLLAGADLLCWIVPFVGLTALQRLVGDPNGPSLDFALLDSLACGLVFILIGASLKLHQGRAPAGSFEDALMVGTTATLVALGNVGLILSREVSGKGTLVVAGPAMALLLMTGTRATYRFVLENLSGAHGGSADAPRVVVVGAGEGARQLVQAVFAHPTPPFLPVAMVDDDPAKRYRRIRGVPVQGTTASLLEVAERNEATGVVIAIPSADGETIRSIARAASAGGLDIKVLPSVGEILHSGFVAIEDVRDIEVTDLLGRHTIDTNVSQIAGYLRGKRVLVTGAGGSIGSELCRQIAQYAPAELIMLDRDESALHAVQLSLTGRALLDDEQTVLGDIRDREFVTDFFASRRPEVVFHAAALKHLPMLEKFPTEAVKTNVWGTLNVLEAARAIGVERFVNISTDKAANPCSVLGYSKRLAEGLTAAVGARAGGEYLSVRFGNVLGSRGSVLTAFTKQIAAGGPVTVTDPAVTRFFMTIAEAVELVIQAGAIGRPGEALVLDMGEPVSIDAVARQLIDLSGKRIQIEYTGLRPAEKMHEELFADGETDERPVHELISHTWVPPFTATQALALPTSGERVSVTRELSDACAMMHGMLAVSRL